METVTEVQAAERVIRPAMVEVTLEVEGEVLVCDPCYFTADGTGDPGDLGYKFDGTGTWKVTTEVSDEGAWGLRTSELIAVRVGTDRFHGAEYEVTREGLGVDAGLMGFIPVQAGPVQDWMAFCEELKERGHYDRARDGQPILVQGRAVSSSGLGDGCYPCYVRDGEDGRPAQVRVAFLEELEEEHEEDGWA